MNKTSFTYLPLGHIENIHIHLGWGVKGIELRGHLATKPHHQTYFVFYLVTRSH